MSNANSNSFRLVGTGKTFLSPTDFIVQVDTSAGAVTLVLPKIDTILSTYATIQQFIGVRFVDISKNASVNNITIEGFETNTINGDRSIVLNTNGVGGMISLIGTSQWNFVQNSVGASSSGGGNYLLQELPTPSCVNYFDKNAIGQAWEYGETNIDTENLSYILLDNGDVVRVITSICILSDETIIVSAPLFSDNGTDPTKRGYLLAFKKSATDSDKLEFLTYLKLTSPIELKMLESGGGKHMLISETEASATLMFPNIDISNADISDSYNFILSYNSATNTLTNTLSFPFNNPISALDIFNQLTGLSVQEGNFKTDARYFMNNGQLKNRALLNGKYEGVVWFRNTNTDDLPVGKDPYNYVCGINYITGQTYITDALQGVINLTNFSNPIPNKAISNFIAHPKGVLFYLYDGLDADNGNNTIGVTGIFSTLWTNNTKCIYLNSRTISNGIFANVNGSYGNQGNDWAGREYGEFDKEYIFQLNFSTDYSNNTAYNVIIWRWKLDSQDLEFETIQIPLAWIDNSAGIKYNSFVSANGYSLLFESTSMIVGSQSYSPTSNGVFWGDKELNPVQLKSNLTSPYAFLNSESYNLIATNSYMGYLVMIDSYDSVKF